MFPGAAYPRPFSYRGQDEQGVRRGPRRGITQDDPGGPRAVVEEISLVCSEAQRKSHPQATPPSARSTPLQPANRPCVSAQRRLSTVLGIQLAALGGPVPGLLVLSNHAQPHRTDEDNRPHAPHTPRVTAELFQGQEGVFQWRGRGVEQQSQSNYEKIL